MGVTSGSTKGGGRVRTALLLQVLGALVLSIGLGLLTPWLGVAAFGLLMLIGGVVLELEAVNGSGKPDSQ